MKWRWSISRLTTRFRILMRRTIISDTHLTEELHGLTFLYRKVVYDIVDINDTIQQKNEAELAL